MGRPFFRVLGPTVLVSALSATTGCDGPPNATPDGEVDAAGVVADSSPPPESGACYFANPAAGADGGVRLAVAVSVGQGSACALTTNQDVQCWGRNDGGELGNGSMTDSPVPVRVMGLDDCIEGVSVGGDSACAYISGGPVRCWGSNQYGQLGNGATTSSPVAVQVTGLTKGAFGVSVGDGFACALIQQAPGDFLIVQCWGRNDRGQLGNGSMTNSVTPVTVKGLTEPTGRSPTVLSAGRNFACAVLSDFTVACWGDNSYGQLANNSTRPSSEPLPIGGLAYASHLSAGGDFACADTDGNLACWGHNSYGQLGTSSGDESAFPLTVGAIKGGVYAVSAGSESVCAMAGGIGVACWGLNSDGQLGNGSMTSSATPVMVSGMANYPNSLSVGGGSACTVSTDGGVSCWGLNADGQLGNGATTSSVVPVPVVGFP